MTIAINLLISAMTLLTMIQQNPNLPQSFKDSAISIANQAIVVAQDEIAMANQTATNPVVINTVTPVQTIQQPTFGGIITHMETPIDKSDIVITLIGTSQPDEVNSIPFGSWRYKVAVLDSEGKNKEMEDVTFSGQDNLYPVKTRKTDAVSTTGMKDWTGYFEYIPTSKGQKTLTFTSGTLSKTITINVQ